MESVTAEREPSSRPVRRWPYDNSGMTARLTAANTKPTVECSASPPPNSDRAASTITTTARAKKENAITRSAVFSRASGSRPANCQATAAAEDTSTTESRPKPINAVDDARVPAANATTASITL